MFCSKHLLLVAALATIISWHGRTCGQCHLPHNCKEAYANGYTTSGVYTIDPGCGEPFQVYCDMDGQWEVIQRRLDGSVDFYLNWTSYVDGFGDPDGEYWLGLKNIHCLTSRVECTELNVSLADFDGVKRFASYSFFSVGNADTNYTLNVGGYNGTAGDALGVHNGTAFSTYDQDNDLSSDNCAMKFTGAWWYAACHATNLNGQYLSGGHPSFADGVNWEPFRGFHYSLKYTAMKIRTG